MAIGNKNYVRKHYGDILSRAIERYEALSRVWPRKKKNLNYVNLALERHRSKHTSAWHGVRLYRDGSFRPISLYGRCYLAPEEWRKILFE